MDWQRIAFNNRDVAAGKKERLMEDFKRKFFEAGAPRTAALYSSPLPDANGLSYAYLSPGCDEFANSILAKYGSEPCEVPPTDIALLVGDARARMEL